MLQFLFTSTPLRYLVDSIWRDEAFTYLLAKRSISEIIAITAQDFNPPLYYLLLHAWMRLFGTSEIAIRSLSLLWYCLGCFIVYEIFRTIMRTSHRRAAFYTALFLLNPLVMYYAFEGRMYSMLFALAMASSYFFLTGKRKAYLVFTVMAVWTHLFMVLVIGAQIVYSLLTKRRGKQRKQDLSISLPLAAIATILPWVGYFLSQNRAVGDGFWVSYLNPGDYPLIPGFLFTGIEKDYWAPMGQNGLVHLYVSVVSGLFATLAGAAAVFGGKGGRTPELRRYFLLVAVVPVVTVVVGQLFQPLFVPRYLIMSSAALSIFAAVTLHSLPRAFQIILSLFIIYAGLQGHLYQLQYRDKGAMRELSIELSRLLDEKTSIYVESELDLMEAQYYFGEDAVFLYQKSYEDIPHYVGKVLISPDRLRDTVPKFPKRAIIISSVRDRDYRIESSFF